MHLQVEFRHDRPFLHAQTEAGARLVFLLDTCGGASRLKPDVAAALGLPVRRGALEAAGPRHDLVAIGATTSHAPLPDPPYPLVLAASESFWDGADGFLGMSWLRDRVWLLDYPRCRMGLSAPMPVGGEWADLPLGLLAPGAGTPIPAYPRIRVAVDGDALDLLFDTGACARLTAQGLAGLDAAGPACRGTSFIIDCVMRRWRERHPDWPHIPAADSDGMHAMIRVPEIGVAGYPIGPVWFTHRRDADFLQSMSKWTDKPVVGALGGSALRYGAWYLDYPRALARFRPG
jgi:hypothetical protein